MTDYKDTLNLPKTTFPMKADLVHQELNILKRWKTLNLYQKLRELRKYSPLFILHDGPPYANGRPHLGTVMNKTLKDIINKAKSLSCFNTPFVPGWDCHGLPIELNVEKKIGKAGKNLSTKEFRQACRNYAHKQWRLQSDDFQRLGILGDWQYPYLTMNHEYEANTVRALAKLIENGYLQHGKKPVHWCTTCGSALAEAEVEYKEKKATAIDVSFTAVHPAYVLKVFSVPNHTHEIKKSVIFPIWTTTPWTLPANQAVGVHPDFYYALVSCLYLDQPIYLVIAEYLVINVMDRYKINTYSIIEKIRGKLLENIRLKHPFLARIVPIVLSEHITTKSGTGNVHIAPAHGEEDYVVATRYRLSHDNTIDARGCFVENTLCPWVAGTHISKANELIIANLSSHGELLHSEILPHSYPHCWRHKTPIIFRTTPQWFLSMDKNNLREKALNAISDVHWLPNWGKERIKSMIENRPDWCISRQRSWGIPIPLFIHKKNSALHPNTPALIEKITRLMEQYGADAWFDCNKELLLGKDANNYEKVTDILDVWFDSGLSHYCVLSQSNNLRIPADLYLEGSDQHRGWFQASLLTALAVDRKAPYKTVLTHGYVVDGKGYKMSKSIGNVIFPDDIIKQKGADILRLWTASCDHRGDMNVSDEILKRSAEAYRRIRNTARFLIANLYDFNPKSDIIQPDQLTTLDRWAIITTKHLQQEIINAFDTYHFQKICQLIHNFCTVDMGRFYLDIIKDRLYTAKKISTARRSAQTSLYFIAEALVRWLAPIISFTADEIWQHLPGDREDSVFFTEWFQDYPTIKISDEDTIDWQFLMHVRDEVNKYLELKRQKGEIGSSLDAQVTLYAEPNLEKKLKKLGDELRFVLITSSAKVFSKKKQFESSDEMFEIQTSTLSGLAINITMLSDKKCERCWQRRPNMMENKKHPTICERCINNIEGQGEIRRFA